MLNWQLNLEAVQLWLKFASLTQMQDTVGDISLSVRNCWSKKE